MSNRLDLPFSYDVESFGSISFPKYELAGSQTVLDSNTSQLGEFVLAQTGENRRTAKNLGFIQILQGYAPFVTNTLKRKMDVPKL